MHRASQILSTAHNPSRIRVGVLEYVRSPEHSLRNRLPPCLRHSVRVHTVGQKTARSLQQSRRTCADALMAAEPYCLFCRGCRLVQGWDAALVQQLESAPKQVLSAPLFGDGFKAGFLCGESFDGMVFRCAKRVLRVEGDSPISSLHFSADLCFCKAEAVATILHRETDLSVSASLHASGYRLKVPGRPIAMLASHPRGVVQLQRSTRSPAVRAYCEVIGIDPETGTVCPRARLGLCAMSASECIAKWGSVAAARILLQQLSTG